jgi:hypothetical protein
VPYFAVDGTGNEGTASAAASDYLILNNGSGQLDNDITATGITESTIKPTMDVKLADLDNDGDLDAVLAVLNDSNQYLENFLFIGPPTPTLDGDGPMFYDVTNEFMLNSIGGTTVPGDPVAFVNTTTSAGFADFDFDGDLDIYIGNGLNAVAGNNVLLFNAGKPLNEGVRVFKSANSPFPAPARVQGGGNLTSAEALNDADFNGIIDAGFGNTPTSDVLIADFDGDGEIGDGVDRNGDGRIDADYDIFVVNNGFRNSLLTNIDTVELEGASPLNLISITTGIVLTANFGVFPSTFEDPDNLGDGLMIDVTGLSLPGPTVNSPNPGYRPGTLDPSLELSRAAAAGDLNGDGRIDIYVANGSEGGIVRNTLLINQGNSVTKGNVPEFIAVNDPVDPGIFNPSSLNARNSADARIFDADSDGDLDIYVADSSASENTSHVLWINNSTPGNLRFDGVQIPIAGLNGLLLQHTTELLVADWDGDGEPTEDINGNGMLDPGEDLDHDGVIDYFDADGDGVFDADYDILLCNTNARDLMLINDGTGTFTDESLARIPDEDRNNNGFLDSGEDTDGNGQIGPVIRDTYDAATADVDLDGDLDIVLAQDFPDAAGTDQAVTLQLLINDGTGVFTDESDHEIGTTAFSALDQTGNLRPAFNANSRCVEFADMDGDGDPDLFIGNIGAVGTGVQVGAYNVVLQNRVVGTNLNARAIAGIAPGFGGPVVKFVSPPVASTTPQQVSLMIRGANFKPGARVDAGPGILHVGNIQEMGGEIIADLRILQGVEPGPRQITIINPDGARGTSQMGAFSLVDIGEGPTPTSVDSNLWSLYH